MATIAEQCGNHALNMTMCPCTSESCERRGVCCECIQAHFAKGGATVCMRETERDPATLDVISQPLETCAQNQERNAAFCVCGYVPCGNRGVCCNCVRNHFTLDGAGRVACMK